MVGKEVLTLDEIKKGLKDAKDKREYLKEFIQDESYQDKKKEITKELQF